MAEYEMTLMDRQKIARDTMAFWLTRMVPITNSERGNRLVLPSFNRPWTLRAAIRGPFLLPVRHVTEGWS
jgi:hypothetical protein